MPSKSRIRTKSIYEPADEGDGLRLLIMRYWPRGVSKARVDEWDRRLAPSAGLVKEWKQGAIAWAQFASRYRQEMRGQSQAMRELAERIRHETATLLCGCPDERRCHRGLLREILERAL